MTVVDIGASSEHAHLVDVGPVRREVQAQRDARVDE